MKRDMFKWVDEVIQSKERKALPIMTYPGLSIVNKTVVNVITDAESQYMCIESLSSRYLSISAVTVMDLSVEAEAFGSKIKYSDNEVPMVIGKIVFDMETAEKLEIPNVGNARTRIFLDASKIASENIKSKPIFGGHIGPFSLAGRLMDMTEIMIMMMEEPDIVHTVLEKCTLFLMEYSKAFKESGANGIIIAEPAAGLLSPSKCEEFSSKYVKRIVDAVQDENFIVILHNCGKTVKLVESMISTGAKAFHFGNAVNMGDILPLIPIDRIAMGNIDPAGVFKNGTTQEMKNEVKDILKGMEPYKNFVLSSGCDIPPGTTLENIDTFFQVLEEYNNCTMKQ